MKYLLVLFLWISLYVPLCAQYTEIYTDDIKTLQLTIGGRSDRFPILQKGKDERLEVCFDDLTHEYRRYTYRIEHCNYDFETNKQLFESEYINSPTNEEVINVYSQSINTAVLYTHYQFTLPNSTIKPLLSGNYKLTIFRETEAGKTEKVAQAFFFIVEPAVNIKASVSPNTDIDYRSKHQQVAIDLDFSYLSMLQNPKEELKMYVLQNRRWDNAVINPASTAIFHHKITWRNTPTLIFKASNEYRKMELLSTRYATMRVEKLYSLDHIFHADITTDYPKQHYLYDEDQNGRFVIRSNDRLDPTIEADYIWTHFQLATPLLPNKRVFVYGRWCAGNFSPAYELHYNTASQAYEASVLLKQGYYSYQYLTTSKVSPTKGETLDTEGDFFQTENEYTILVYYRSHTERYDRLVGFTQIHSTP